MKIAVPAKGMTKADMADDRFGRAAYYVIYDSETKEVYGVENTAKDEVSGAGGQAVRLLDKEGVKVTLVPEVGPKALQAFKAFDIKAYTYGKDMTVEAAIEEYEAGKLQIVETESHDGHHGLRRA
ncbi:MAG: NifB/NifX family molybdenum-iron cluster-binding protein [Clostridia bacterium]|nr:NifB/NifX family molybdenum-iron cluster-binding protein [Clostridia bacterium]